MTALALVALGVYALGLVVAVLLAVRWAGPDLVRSILAIGWGTAVLVVMAAVAACLLWPVAAPVMAWREARSASARTGG